MPSFPQFALESLLAFWFLLGYYRLTHFHVNSFSVKRWQLRMIPVFAGLLPLLPAVFLTKPAEVPFEKQAMSLSQILDYHFPEFTISIATVLLAVYFGGVLVSSFRLMDRLWLVQQFLENRGSRFSRLIPWQAMPTAAMSSLVLNWQFFDEEKKEEWVKNWLPIHPVFAWEALMVELLVVLNWWNPMAYRYRKHWAELYGNWQTERQQQLDLFTLKSLGFVGVAAGLGFVFTLLPAKFSPTHRVGDLAAQFFKKTVFENKIEKPHEYYIAWGDLKMPLTKFANPNGYSANLELELADFQDVVDKPITVFKDGQSLKPGIFSIFYKRKMTGTQAYINGIDPKKVVLRDRKNGLVFNDSLDLGDELLLFGDTEDIYLSKVEIRIKDPDAGYEPSVFVPEINQLEATMPYQIIARKGRRALVKIDPNNPNTDRIVALYADARQYEIVRIPGFRTNRHYITEAESLASKVAAANTTIPYLAEYAYYLPEFQTYQGKEVRMVWGKMSASPSNSNYPLDSFLLSNQYEPQLLVGEDTLFIASFQIIVAGKKATPRSFFTNSTGDLEVREALQNVQNETSIYFDKIVVFDKDGQRKLFPASFAFNVGDLDNPHHRPRTDKNYMLFFGEKTEVVKAPIFKNKAQDAMKKTTHQGVKKKKK